jgi:hypothetical protein
MLGDFQNWSQPIGRVCKNNSRAVQQEMLHALQMLCIAQKVISHRTIRLLILRSYLEQSVILGHETGCTSGEDIE